MNPPGYDAPGNNAASGGREPARLTLRNPASSRWRLAARCDSPQIRPTSVRILDTRTVPRCRPVAGHQEAAKPPTVQGFLRQVLVTETGQLMSDAGRSVDHRSKDDSHRVPALLVRMSDGITKLAGKS